MYEFIDKNLEKIKKNILAYFQDNRLSIMKYDEINTSQIDGEVDNLFDRIDSLAEKLYEKEVESVSKQYDLKEDYSYDKFLDSYNPTTLYVYKNEIARKRDRYKENVKSSILGYKGVLEGNRGGINNDALLGTLTTIAFAKNLQANVNNISRQIEETAVDMERNMFFASAEEKEIEYVRWVTEGDDRVCGDCRQLEGQIFPIDEVPIRPHIGCRCELEYSTEKEYKEQMKD